MPTLLEKVEKYLTFGGLVGTLVGGSILASAAHFSSPERYTPETVRALRLRDDLRHETSTPGFLHDKPLNYFVQAQQEYNDLLGRPEVRSSIQQANFLYGVGAFGGGLVLLSAASLSLGLLLQQRRLEQLRADVAAYRLREAGNEGQFVERLLDPELQEPSPPRKHELRRLE